MESKTYVFDTDVILGYARDAPYSRYIDSEYDPIQGDHITVVSVVSRGEIFHWRISSDGDSRSERRCNTILTR